MTPKQDRFPSSRICPRVDPRVTSHQSPPRLPPSSPVSGLPFQSRSLFRSSRDRYTSLVLPNVTLWFSYHYGITLVTRSSPTTTAITGSCNGTSTFFCSCVFFFCTTRCSRCMSSYCYSPSHSHPPTGRPAPQTFRNSRYTRQVGDDSRCRRTNVCNSRSGRTVGSRDASSTSTGTYSRNGPNCSTDATPTTRNPNPDPQLAPLSYRNDRRRPLNSRLSHTHLPPPGTSDPPVLSFPMGREVKEG